MLLNKTQKPPTQFTIFWPSESFPRQKVCLADFILFYIPPAWRRRIAKESRSYETTRGITGVCMLQHTAAHCNTPQHAATLLLRNAVLGQQLEESSACAYVCAL